MARRSTVTIRSTDLVVMNGRSQLLREPWEGLTRLEILGADNKVDAITVDLSKGGIVPPLVIVVDGGTGSHADSLTILGTAGNDWFAVDRDGVLVNGNLLVSFGDIQQVALDGGAGDDLYSIRTMPEVLSIADKHKTSIDTLDFSAAAAGVVVDLNSTRPQTILGGRLTLKSKLENLVGTPFDDILYGNNLNNRIWGGDGDDRIEGRRGNNWLYGEAGKDRLIGGRGNDVLLGGDGDDTLTGTAGRNLLIGGSGNDVLQGGSGDDILMGGPIDAYGLNDAALTDIMRQWTSRLRVDARVDSIRDQHFGGATFQRVADTPAKGPEPVNRLRGGRGADWALLLDGDLIDEVLERTDIVDLVNWP